MRIMSIGNNYTIMTLPSGASLRKEVWVQVPSPAPYLWNKKDVHPLKPVSTGFFGILGAKNLWSKPWMLFRHFHEQEGFEPSTKKIKEKFKADLREKILNLPFLIYKIIHKVFKAVF